MNCSHLVLRPWESIGGDFLSPRATLLQGLPCYATMEDAERTNKGTKGTRKAEKGGEEG